MHFKHKHINQSKTCRNQMRFQTKLTSFHLPDICSAIGTADNHVVFNGSPLNRLYWKHVSASKH